MHLHFFHDGSSAGGAQDQQLASLGGLFLQQHQQGLQDGVAEARPDGHILQQPLYVIQNDDGEGGLQGTQAPVTGTASPCRQHCCRQLKAPAASSGWYC